MKYILLCLPNWLEMRFRALNERKCKMKIYEVIESTKNTEI